MRVADLIRLLEDCDRDAEVRFASQPSWPFEYSIDDVHEHWTDPESDEWEEPEDSDDEDELPTVYLVEGSQLGYLPGDVKRDLGW